MKLKEIGEFGFIDRFSPLFRPLIPAGTTGIGDDCAIIPVNDKEDIVITTDLLVENTHFLKKNITPLQLGYKSLAVNLSDIAAMGGTPVGSFLSLAIPSSTEVEYLDVFMEGYHELSEKFGVPLLGGDTTKSPEFLTVSVCVIGKCLKGEAKLRSTAKEGDMICVTGFLGDSAGGLQLILEGRGIAGSAGYLLEKHYMPVPRIGEGRLLASLEGVNSLMDISDGLASDLLQILKASGKRAVVEMDKVPMSPELLQTAGEFGWDSLELALTGGEDYELLCTVSPKNFNMVKESIFRNFKRQLFHVGSIFEGSPAIEWTSGNQVINMDKKGFDHFK
jgi:thiamine-monophosphate kinase